MERSYYEAYEDRYRSVHALGHAWSSDVPTPIVADVLSRYGIGRSDRILEIGCGEGRDAHALLAAGYDLLATDVSPEAVAYCRRTWPEFAERFQRLDCLREKPDGRYRMILAVAVVHMLVPDGDRARFYGFIREHLADGGIALICTMGDGETEFQTDIRQAFDVQTREHPAGEVAVAATSCRMVSFKTFEKELAHAGLHVEEKGVTPCPPDFDRLMYAVVRK